MTRSPSAARSRAGREASRLRRLRAHGGYSAPARRRASSRVLLRETARCSCWWSRTSCYPPLVSTLPPSPRRVLLSVPVAAPHPRIEIILVEPHGATRPRRLERTSSHGSPDRGAVQVAVHRRFLVIQIR